MRMLKEVNHKRSLKESTLPASPGQENETDKSNSRRRGHKAAWFSAQIKQWYQKALPMEAEFLLIKDMVRKCPVCMIWNGSKHDSLLLRLGFNQRHNSRSKSLRSYSRRLFLSRSFSEFIRSKQEVCLDNRLCCESSSDVNDAPSGWLHELHLEGRETRTEQNLRKHIRTQRCECRRIHLLLLVNTGKINM